MVQCPGAQPTLRRWKLPSLLTALGALMGDVGAEVGWGSIMKAARIMGLRGQV